jgi:hypothetical protein
MLLVLEIPAVAKTFLDRQRTDNAETEVAQVRLANGLGEPARIVPDLRNCGGG